jgi:hypothetical protein
MKIVTSLAHILAMSITTVLVAAVLFWGSARAGWIPLQSMFAGIGPSNFEHVLGSAFLGIQVVFLIAVAIASVITVMAFRCTSIAATIIGGSIPYLLLTMGIWTSSKIFIFIAVVALIAIITMKARKYINHPSPSW